MTGRRGSAAPETVRMSKNDILQHLRSAKSEHVSGAELARRLGVSRTAVWKHIKTLEHEGYGIEAVPSKGYRMTKEPDRIRPSEVNDLAGNLFSGHIRYHAEIASTNTLGMELSAKGAPEGTVVIAEVQTGGKGRLGRHWVSPAGNLYFSVVLRPPVAPQQAPIITLMGAVAAASAIKKTTGISAGIKWPNDILIEGRKVCGLLTEMSAEVDRIRHLVLGVGINCNMDLSALPEDVRRQATTVAEATGRMVDRTHLLSAVLAELDQGYREFLRDRQRVLDAWKALNVTIGRAVSVSGAGEILQGMAADIDSEGRLMLRLADGTMRTVTAGDVTIVKGQV